jgi:hypothetical protein
MAIIQPSGSSEAFGAMSISFVIIMLFMILVLFAVFIPLYYLVIFIMNTVLVHSQLVGTLQVKVLIMLGNYYSATYFMLLLHILF